MKLPLKDLNPMLTPHTPHKIILVEGFVNYQMTNTPLNLKKDQSTPKTSKKSKNTPMPRKRPIYSRNLIND